jgi:hypothetical protein
MWDTGVSLCNLYRANIYNLNNTRWYFIARLILGHSARNLPRTDWVAIPTRDRLVSFISCSFYCGSSTFDLIFRNRSWYAGRDDEIPLNLLSYWCIMMKWKIHSWRWSTLPICKVWRKSGFTRSITIQGICQNLFNLRLTCRDQRWALAALVWASLSLLSSLLTCQGYFLSGETYSPGSIFGHSHLKEQCRSR